MGITRISSLFAVNADALASAGKNNQQSAASSQNEVAQQQASSSEAVTVSSSLRGQNTTASTEERSNRVSEIKDLVSRGAYNKDSRDVATVLVRDLF